MVTGSLDLFTLFRPAQNDEHALPSQVNELGAPQSDASHDTFQRRPPAVMVPRITRQDTDLAPLTALSFLKSPDIAHSPSSAFFSALDSGTRSSTWSPMPQLGFTSNESTLTAGYAPLTPEHTTPSTYSPLTADTLLAFNKESQHAHLHPRDYISVDGWPYYMSQDVAQQHGNGFPAMSDASLLSAQLLPDTGPAPVQMAHISADHAQLLADPAHLSIDPMQFSGDPTQLSADPQLPAEPWHFPTNLQVPAEPSQFSGDPNQSFLDPNQLSVDPRQLSADPRQFSNDSRQLSPSLQPLSNDFRQLSAGSQSAEGVSSQTQLSLSPYSQSPPPEPIQATDTSQSPHGLDFANKHSPAYTAEIFPPVPVVEQSQPSPKKAPRKRTRGKPRPKTQRPKKASRPRKKATAAKKRRATQTRQTRSTAVSSQRSLQSSQQEPQPQQPQPQQPQPQQPQPSQQQVPSQQSEPSQQQPQSQPSKASQRQLQLEQSRPPRRVTRQTPQLQQSHPPQQAAQQQPRSQKSQPPRQQSQPPRQQSQPQSQSQSPQPASVDAPPTSTPPFTPPSSPMPGTFSTPSLLEIKPSYFMRRDVFGKLVIKRPENAFMLYRKDRAARMRDAVQANMVIMPQQKVSKLISERWREESDEVKASYGRKAAEMRMLHATFFPRYKYRGNTRP